MKPPADDLDCRRPVWEAMSAFFLDNEVDDEWRAEIVGVLRSSGYSQPELDAIFWTEVCPALYPNLGNPVGVWEGFDMEFVEREILTNPPGRLRQWWVNTLGGIEVRGEWKKVRAAMGAD